MNNADLVWRLVELLLQQEKNNQVALDQDQSQNDTKQDDKRQNKA